MAKKKSYIYQVRSDTEAKYYYARNMETLLANIDLTGLTTIKVGEAKEPLAVDFLEFNESETAQIKKWFTNEFMKRELAAQTVNNAEIPIF